MKVIIAGSRSIDDYPLVEKAVLESRFAITEVVSGGAHGVDYLGECYGFKNKIPIRVMKAKWEEHGKSAGAIRNSEMANYAEAVIVIWDGRSPGSKNMINCARVKGLPLFIYKL
jgi:hypothetical protein